MIPRVTLIHDYSISRIIKGGWHLAGDHGAIDPIVAQHDMAQFVDAGITTFDCADIYTGVEALIGRFRETYPEHAKQVQVHTKFVPDLKDLANVDGAYVENIVDRSLTRLKLEALDLVQFHWWDFGVPGYVETALELDRLRRLGKIRHIGITNFDVAHMEELLAAGVSILTNQVQYSLLDDRPTQRMVEFCRTRGISLLCYGTVCGGFMSERWLDQPAPGPALTNRSLVKYQLIIDDFGGWTMFQTLLKVLQEIAEKHGTDIASIASRAILDRPQVAGVIVGAVNTHHLKSHAQMGDIHMTDDDWAAIAAITCRRRGPQGDVYELERDRTGVHGRIMKYELNSLPT